MPSGLGKPVISAGLMAAPEPASYVPIWPELTT